MNLYRFSPIQSEGELLEAIQHIHFACFKLCKKSFNEYLPISGNIGVFCHYENEYKLLTQLREELTEKTDNINQKYFRLRKPITIPSREDIPETTYTFLYIRKPDPYRFHVGDVDFVLEKCKYAELKESLQNRTTIKGARIFERSDLDMVELYHPDIDVLAYVSPGKTTGKIRVK